MDLLALPADRGFNLIEHWMEEMAVQPKEEHEARDQVSLILARAAKAASDPAPDPGSEPVPPHLRGRR